LSICVPPGDFPDNHGNPRKLVRGVWVSYEEKNRETGCGVEGMRIKSSGERGLLTPIPAILNLFEVS